MPKTNARLALLLLCVVPGAAQAQRVDDNAVRAAEDGFGSSVGNCPPSAPLAQI